MSNEGEMMSIIVKKLDGIQEDVSAIKVEQAVMKTNMERNKEANLPTRVDNLESFKTKVITYGTLAAMVIPAIVTVLIKKVL